MVDRGDIALAAATFGAGIAVGLWLRRPREDLPRRSYDREAEDEALAATWRASGLREQLKRRVSKGDGTEKF